MCQLASTTGKSLTVMAAFKAHMLERFIGTGTSTVQISLENWVPLVVWYLGVDSVC
jgi:hypothetical protein